MERAAYRIRKATNHGTNNVRLHTTCRRNNHIISTLSRRKVVLLLTPDEESSRGIRNGESAGGRTIDFSD